MCTEKKTQTETRSSTSLKAKYCPWVDAVSRTQNKHRNPRDLDL